MTAQKDSSIWGRAIVEELAGAGIDLVVVAPGSRSTPVVLAADAHPSITVGSILDERSAGFFALGYAKRTHRAAAVISTSGTAAANFHPAVIEADRSRTPLIVCTADRPPRLHGSGANQTVRQDGLFGGAVRDAPLLPPPSSDTRDERALRTNVATAVARASAPIAGPVHLNVPLEKPLSPVDQETGTVRDIDISDRSGTVTIDESRVMPDPAAVDRLAEVITGSQRGVIVAGPTTEDCSEGVVTLAEVTGYPVLADPLSGARFTERLPRALVCGGYDSFLDERNTTSWPRPDLVIRTGARPTSTTLESFLEDAEQQILLDPAGEYRDPTFSTTELLPGSADLIGPAIRERLDDEAVEPAWADLFREAEATYWHVVSDRIEDLPPEGRIAHDIFAHAPPEATVFVSNSMPIRDADRFGQPASVDLTVLGNRGASGIDGIVSSGLGAASALGEETIVHIGDLALYHDMNGLIAIDRCNVDATFVVVNNDGGGIFHKLPIASIDPPFTEQFRTPHGLNFEHVAALYELEYVPATPAGVPAALKSAVDSTGSTLIDVSVNAEENHRQRDTFLTELLDRLPSAG